MELVTGETAPIDEPAPCGRRAAKDWPEDRVEGNLKLRRKGQKERRREEEFDGTGGGGACVVPVLSKSSGPARASNILVHEGSIPSLPSVP